MLIPPIRAGIQAVDPDQPIYEIKTLDRVISESVVGLSYVAVIMGILGLIAMVLAAMGVYGIMAYAVVERTHEIGVRLALGAQPREIMRLILSRGTFLLALGIAIGLPVAYALARLALRRQRQRCGHLLADHYFPGGGFNSRLLHPCVSRHERGSDDRAALRIGLWSSLGSDAPGPGRSRSRGEF